MAGPARLQPENAIVQAIIDARRQSGLTQKKLSEQTGIAQGDISKLERGNANSSWRTLQRLAAGLGMIIKLEFLLSVIREREQGASFLAWKENMMFIDAFDRPTTYMRDDIDAYCDGY